MMLHVVDLLHKRGVPHDRIYLSMERNMKCGVGFSRVVSVTLLIGERSGASIEALEFCFPMVAKGTVAEGATLAFTRTQDDALRVAELEVGE